MNSELIEEPEELIPGLILHKTIKDAPLSDEEYKNILEMELENKTITKINLEMNFYDFKNIDFFEDEKNKINEKLTFTLEPNDKKKIAKIKMKKDFKINIKFNFNLCVPDKNIQIILINGQNDKYKLIEKKCYEKLNKIDLTLKTKEELEILLNKYDINNFIDWSFPPNENSIINNNLGISLNDYLKYIPYWKRPNDFINLKNAKIKNKYYLYNQEFGPLPNDIIKGYFDDKNLISVLSALSEKNNLIKRLFVNNNNSISEKGIYQIQLYIKGQWRIIIIDDLFPCYIIGNPIVSRSPSNIIWVLLLEKAIAKIYKCYYNIKNLKISDCFLLLTGFPTFYFNINELKDKIDNEEEEEEEGEKLLEKLKYFLKDKNYICQAVRENQEDIDEDDMDLNENLFMTLPDYGYTILDILNLKNNDDERQDILILRKIWFDKDKEEILEKEQENLKNNFNELNNILNEINIGITYSNFIQEFNTLYVCYTKNWETISIKSQFIRINQNKVNENVLTEKYFEFEGSGNIIISLYQDDDENNKINNKKQLMDLSLTLLKYDINNNEISHKETIDFFHTSSLQMEFNNLPLGNYIIYPKTSGCFLGKPINNNNNEKIDYKNNIFVEDTIKDIFNLYDTKLNNYLDYEDFNSFYKKVFDQDLTKNEFENDIINNYDNYKKIGISKIGFKNYFDDFIIKKNDINEIQKIFEKFGYDKDLYNKIYRQYILTIHSEKELNIKIKDNIRSNMNSKLYKILLKLIGKNWVSKENDQFIPKYLKSESNIITIGLFNKTDKNLNVTLRLKNTNNFILGGNYKYILNINTGETEFITNIYCINNDYFDSLQFIYETKEI